MNGDYDSDKTKKPTKDGKPAKIVKKKILGTKQEAEQKFLRLNKLLKGKGDTWVHSYS